MVGYVLTTMCGELLAVWQKMCTFIKFYQIVFFFLDSPVIIFLKYE